MPSQAHRLDTLPPYVFAVIGDRLRQMQSDGIDVIRLDIGSPDMPPPDFVAKALAEAANNPNNHGYSGYRGTPSFRKAVARYYANRFGVDVNPDRQVLPLIGSKEGIVNFTLAYLDKGDVALIPAIGYPSYAQAARLAGAEIYWVPLSEETDYLPDLSAIPSDILRRSKILWVNYPNNPTGATVGLEFYEQAVSFCRKHDILLASDNPYADVTFDDYVAESALKIKDSLPHTIEFFSMSKSHNMAGWRLGAAISSEETIETLLTVKSNMDSGHFKAMYTAGEVALDETPAAWIAERNSIYKVRRDKILTALPKIGLSAQVPKGSLYIWAKVLNGDAQSYVDNALSNAHVSLAPGGAYGPSGDDYIRISIGIADDRLDQALLQLETWYNSQ